MKNIKGILGGLVAVVALVFLIGGIGASKDSSNSPKEEVAVVTEYDQLLIKVGESGSGAGSSKDGDIIVIKGSDQKWGRMEKMKFLIVRVPKLTDEEKAEFATANEDGLRIYGVDYTKFLTEDEVNTLRQKTAAFSLARETNAANVFYATTGEQYPIISKEDIAKKEAGAESAIPDDRRLTTDKI